MADHQAACRAAKTPIGHQHHILAQTSANERGSDAEHLSHPGPSLRAFVPDDNDVAFLNCSPGDGFHGVFFRSEEHTSELQSRQYLVCRLLLEKKKQILSS